MIYLSLQKTLIEKSLGRYLKYNFGVSIREYYRIQQGSQDRYFICLQKLLRIGHDLFILNPGLDLAENFEDLHIIGFYIFQTGEINNEQLINLTKVSVLKRNIKSALEARSKIDWKTLRDKIQVFTFQKHRSET